MPVPRNSVVDVRCGVSLPSDLKERLVRSDAPADLVTVLRIILSRLSRISCPFSDETPRRSKNLRPDLTGVSEGDESAAGGLSTKDQGLAEDEAYKCSLEAAVHEPFSIDGFDNKKGRALIELTIGRRLDQKDSKRKKRFRGPPTFTVPECAWTASVCVSAEPIAYAGRYTKFSRHLAQTKWGMKDAFVRSIEDICGEAAEAVLNTGSVKLVGAGREDRDVRMLGTGRRFVLVVNRVFTVPAEHAEGACDGAAKRAVKEATRGPVTEPCASAEEYSAKALAEKINEIAEGQMQVHDLKLLGATGHEVSLALKRFHSETDQKYLKLYGFVFKTNIELPDAIVANFKLTEPTYVLQKTPFRVLHRRANLARKRRIYSLDIQTIKPRLYVAKALTGSGAYIKEFVHGDLGRTEPSLGLLLRNAIGDPTMEISCDLVLLDVLALVLDNAKDGESSEEAE